MALSESYRNNQLSLMDSFKMGLTPEYSIVTADLVIKRWTIGRLLAKNISYVALNMGAGVMKITTRTDTCPKCKGLGCIAAKPAPGGTIKLVGLGDKTTLV